MAKNTKKDEIIASVDDVTPTEALVVPVAAEADTTEAMPLGEQAPISGRGVFAVSRVDVGVAVHTAFLAEDGRLLQMPAVFPNLEYALQQVDEMRQMVINQFTAN